MLPRAPDWAGPRAEALFKMLYGTHTWVVRFQASARNPNGSHRGETGRVTSNKDKNRQSSAGATTP
eukprot:14833463-Alexandrium_andersonii.AAC.1